MRSDFYPGDCPACGARVESRLLCPECGYNLATAAGVEAEQQQVEDQERRWIRTWPRRRAAEILGFLVILYFIAQVIYRL